MFDIGWQELFIVAILAVIVVGPKELPRVLRTVMGVVRKARSMARDFQDGLDDVVREADLEDIKNSIGSMADGDLAKTIEDAMDPDGEIAKDLDMTEIQNDIGKMATESSTPESEPATDAEDVVVRDVTLPPGQDAASETPGDDAPEDKKEA